MLDVVVPDLERARREHAFRRVLELDEHVGLANQPEPRAQGLRVGRHGNPEGLRHQFEPHGLLVHLEVLGVLVPEGEALGLGQARHFREPLRLPERFRVPHHELEVGLRRTLVVGQGLALQEVLLELLLEDHQVLGAELRREALRRALGLTLVLNLHPLPRLLRSREHLPRLERVEDLRRRVEGVRIEAEGRDEESPQSLAVIHEGAERLDTQDTQLAEASNRVGVTVMRRQKCVKTCVEFRGVLRDGACRDAGAHHDEDVEHEEDEGPDERVAANPRRG